jgi:glycerol kinase
MQVIADVTGRRMDTASDPQQAGAVGCALTVAVALGVLSDYKEIKKVVRVRRSLEPRSRNSPSTTGCAGSSRIPTPLYRRPAGHSTAKWQSKSPALRSRAPTPRHGQPCRLYLKAPAG